jgi:hypothetical protein
LVRKKGSKKVELESFEILSENISSVDFSSKPKADLPKDSAVSAVKKRSKKFKLEGKKFYRKPKADLPKYSAVSAVKKIAENTEPLVKEGRTGYFQKEMMEEKRKWLR